MMRIICFLLFFILTPLVAQEELLYGVSQEKLNKFLKLSDKEVNDLNIDPRTLKLLNTYKTRLKNNTKKKTLPLYEVGLGFLHSHFPHYPGSSLNHSKYLPFPPFTFRGDLISADKDNGLRTDVFNSKYVELDLSFDGTIPSGDQSGSKREGMRELDAIIELGPSIVIHFIPLNKINKFEFDFQIATRYAFSTNAINYYDQGATINPFFTFKIHNLFQTKDLFIFGYGQKYATRKLTQIYYNVEKSEQTVDRTYYEASGGLIEKSFSFALFEPLNKRKDIWFFGGFIYANYKDSANRESPLLENKSSTSIIAGIFWNFYKSKTVVVPNY